MVASKPSSTRARRNRASTRAVLQPVENPEIPDLPPYCDWHPAVVEFWESAWSSPMPQEWTESDSHNVLMAARAFQVAWDPDTGATARSAAMAEARLWLRECGLTPMSRRSLQIEIAKAEDASDRTELRRAVKPAVKSARPDPRAGMRAV